MEGKLPPHIQSSKRPLKRLSLKYKVFPKGVAAHQTRSFPWFRTTAYPPDLGIGICARRSQAPPSPHQGPMAGGRLLTAEANREMA